MSFSIAKLAINKAKFVFFNGSSEAVRLVCLFTYHAYVVVSFPPNFNILEWFYRHIFWILQYIMILIFSIDFNCIYCSNLNECLWCFIWNEWVFIKFILNLMHLWIYYIIFMNLKYWFIICLFNKLL
jgi:hypothetical protein